MRSAQSASIGGGGRGSCTGEESSWGVARVSGAIVAMDALVEVVCGNGTRVKWNEGVRERRDGTGSAREAQVTLRLCFRRRQRAQFSRHLSAKLRRMLREYNFHGPRVIQVIKLAGGQGYSKEADSSGRSIVRG